MMATQTPAIQSPCVGVCSIDQDSGFCEGCFRTLDEIRQWRELDDQAKIAIIDLAQAREAAVFSD